MTKPNYTQVSNEFLDGRMAELSGAAVKVFLVITRKTIGWHKDTDAVSYSQLKASAGFGSKTTISQSLKELIEAGLIIATKTTGGTTIYELSMTSPESGHVTSPESGHVTSPETGPGVSRNWTGTSPESGHTKESLKETPQKKLIYTSEFNTFWEAYPRNTNKRGAFKCWLKLMEYGVAPDLIIRCAINYAAKTKTDKTEMNFILHASTFLGPNRRFEDFETAEQTSDVPSGYFVDKNDTAYQDGVKVGHYDGSRFIPSA